MEQVTRPRAHADDITTTPFGRAEAGSFIAELSPFRRPALNAGLSASFKASVQVSRSNGGARESLAPLPRTGKRRSGSYSDTGKSCEPLSGTRQAHKIKCGPGKRSTFLRVLRFSETWNVNLCSWTKWSAGT